MAPTSHTEEEASTDDPLESLQIEVTRTLRAKTTCLDTVMLDRDYYESSRRLTVFYAPRPSGIREARIVNAVLSEYDQLRLVTTGKTDHQQVEFEVEE